LPLSAPSSLAATVIRRQNRAVIRRQNRAAVLSVHSTSQPAGRRGALGAAVATLALVAAGCGGDDGDGGGPAKDGAPATAGKSNVVEIRDFKYFPPKASVKKGESITVSNVDTADHTITASDGKVFDTGVIKPKEKKKLTFDEPGSFPYICDLHPFMKGEIVVQ